MMDYYGSFIKPKEEIYKETISVFTPLHGKEYITPILDSVYERKIIDEAVSVSGWLVFVSEIVFKEVQNKIHTDTERAKKRLLLAKCLEPVDELCPDIQERISEFV
jgi:hypothetical protein